jgi:hypothetical protein
MNGRSSCSPRALANGQVLRVEYCGSCNVLSLHFGPLTLRLQPDAAECAWATLGDALRSLHQQRERCAARSRADLAS